MASINSDVGSAEAISSLYVPSKISQDDSSQRPKLDV